MRTQRGRKEKSVLLRTTLLFSIQHPAETRVAVGLVDLGLQPRELTAVINSFGEGVTVLLDVLSW